MSSPDTSDGELPAGAVSSWLGGMQAALAGEADAEVPCGGCTACCTSSQFVHIGPDETDALAHIPTELRFPAPLAPPGHVVLAYDEHGRCPMLGDGGCTIYAHRPRACRTYDCRVLAAAGVEPDEPTKVEIARRVRRWRFAVPTDDDRRALAAVRAAASFLALHRDDLPPELRPATATQLAVVAVEAHGAFLGDGARDAPTVDAVVAQVRAMSDGATGHDP